MSQQFSIEGLRYCVAATGTFWHGAQGKPNTLVTVISLPAEGLTAQEFPMFLRGEIQRYINDDDVFHVKFLQGIIFITPPGQEFRKLVTSPAVREMLKPFGNRIITDIEGNKYKEQPRPGPYVLRQHLLAEVYKLYDDTQGAFLMSFLPDRENQHLPLLSSSERPTPGFVAVPSRLRRESSGSKPLSGMRIAVKDNFHVRGVKTSVCNRAYYELYPPQLATARCIEKLEHAGATILGTTKMASFAATEEPIECIDYQAPWNPRGDGYQSPAGSSSGSGVAVASCEWVDIAIGSDTSGSGRRPGHWNGCFALRPTHGAVSTEGLVTSFAHFDTPTFFARNIHTCRICSSVLPIQILVEETYMSLIRNKDQLSVLHAFVTDLEASLAVKHRSISLPKIWDWYPSERAHGESLNGFMKDAGRNSFFHDDYHNLDHFRQDYSGTFSMQPYVSSPVRWQWDLSSCITRKERDEAVDRLDVYRDWFLDQVMEIGRKRTIVMLPIENISPRYRDEATTNFNPVGVPMLFLSPIIGGPELVVPVGQVPYQSRVSGIKEYLPVGVSLLAEPGMDLEVIDIARNCLERARGPVEVKVGKIMFDVGKVKTESLDEEIKMEE